MTTEAKIKEALAVMLSEGEITAEEAKQKLDNFRALQQPQAQTEMPQPQASVVSTPVPVQEVNPKLSAGEKALGVGETALSIGSSMLGQAVSGLAGMESARRASRERTGLKYFMQQAEKGVPLEDLAVGIEPMDLERGVQTAERIQQMMTYTPKTKPGQRVMERTGELAEGVGKAVSPWVNNTLTSLYAAIPFMPEEKVQSFEASLSEKGLNETLGDYVMEETGNAELATLSYLTPDLFMETVGTIVGGKVGKAVAKSRADKARAKADAQAEELQALSTEGAPSREAAAEDIVREQDIELAAKFDPLVVEAAQELGFEEIPPSVAAGNQQFRDVTRVLESVPRSTAKANYGEFMELMANKADEIIEQGGGTLDKAELSVRFRDKTENMIDEFIDQEKKLYEEIKPAIGEATFVDIPNLRNFIDGEVDKYAGNVSRMPKVYRDIYNLVYEPDVDGIMQPRQPTYTEFDQKRRDVGAALGKKSSPYPDAEERTLKQVYGNLKADQNAITEFFGVKELQDAADAITIKRKALEKVNTEILGAKLQKDLMPEMAGKITALPKGNVSKFTKLVEDIPKDLREEVVVSALNDIMKGTGADQKGWGTPRFLGMMNELNRQPTAKAALYKYIPADTQKALDNFHTLTDAVYKANRETIKTGMIQTFFPDQRGFLSRLMGRGAQAVATATAGQAGSVAADAVKEFLLNTTPKSRKANDFIASKEFQELIQNAVKDGVHEGNSLTQKSRDLQRQIKKTKAYEAWADTLDAASLAEISSLGLVNYLLYPEELEQTIEDNQN